MNIAVFLFGSLGDTLIALPALWVLRKRYPKDRITILSDVQIGRSLVGARPILAGSGVADDIVEYETSAFGGKTFGKIKGILSLWRQARALKPDLLVYLVRGPRDQKRVFRDMFFFRFSGVRSIIGVDGMPASPPPQAGTLPRMLSQADQYLARLGSAGLPVPAPGQGRCDLGLQEEDWQAAREWEAKLSRDGGRPWIAFAPGSKMPSKLWPEDRYGELGRRLIASHDIWPVVFGGLEDREAGGRLIRAWGRGHMAAGQLGIRSAAAALSRCRLYIGNDTGTMHLAASAGIRCLALFSARENAGLWEPYGAGHVILRRDIPCAGCLGITCPRGDNLCLQQITVEEAEKAANRLLGPPDPEMAQRQEAG